MDEDLYDEFGNYIGPDLDSEGSEEDEQPFQAVRSPPPARSLPRRAVLAYAVRFTRENRRNKEGRIKITHQPGRISVSWRPGVLRRARSPPAPPPRARTPM